MFKLKNEFQQKHHPSIIQKILFLFAIVSVIFACNKKTNISRGPSNIPINNPQIVGGEEVNVKDPLAKYLVSISSSLNGNTCTGVLLSAKLVLTAAHCTLSIREPKDISIGFGLNLRKNQIKKIVSGVQVTDQWLMFNDNKDKDIGDLAILRFEGDLPPDFEPAPLVTTSISALPPSSQIIIAGYGNQSMNPFKDLKKLFKALVIVGSSLDLQSSEFTLPNYQGANACHGDSGGPAFSANPELTVLGIASRSATAEGAISCGEGTIYTNVLSYIDFINKAKASMESTGYIPDLPVPQPGNMFH